MPKRHLSFENLRGKLNTFLFEGLTHFLFLGPERQQDFILNLVLKFNLVNVPSTAPGWGGTDAGVTNRVIQVHRLDIVGGGSIVDGRTIRRLAFRHAVDGLGPDGETVGCLVTRVAVTTDAHFCSVANRFDAIGDGHFILRREIYLEHIRHDSGFSREHASFSPVVGAYFHVKPPDVF